MCRLFGFHSVTKSQVHQSLVAAENALMIQSKGHPDGWGIAYYLQGVPHVMKSLASANTDEVFKRLGETLTSNTVIAHVRRATRGEINLVNCHPFQYGNWIFAHNGDMPDFESFRDELLKHVDEELRTYIFGSTDSEVYFALFLSELSKLEDLADKNPSLKNCALAIRRSVEKIEIFFDPKSENQPSLNLTVSNGSLMLGYCQGRELNYSSYKRSCVEAKNCPFVIDACTNKTSREGEKISHLLISSEPLVGENIWESCKERQIIGIDHELRFYRNL